MPAKNPSDSKLKIILILVVFLAVTFLIPLVFYIILSKAIPITNPPPKEEVKLTELTSSDLKELTFIPEKYQSTATKKAYEISEFGRIAALKIKDGEREFYLVNGNEEPKYDSIEKITFSPDGERYAYKVKNGEKNVIMLDGKEIDGGFEAIISYLFTPDSHNFFIRYIKNHQKYFFDTNNNSSLEIQPFIRKDNYSYPANSLSGNKIAYYESFNDVEKRYFYFEGNEQVNFTISTYYRPNLIISPDLKHYAYNAGSKMIVDGVAQKQYESVSTPQFSPAGNRFAYIATVGKKSFVVSDGLEGEQYDKISSKLYFSPDGKTLVYFAENHGQVINVVNNQEGTTQGYPYSEVLFSPDGTYYFLQGNSLIKNREIVASDPESYSLILSPDGTKIAYVGRKDYQSYAVINGVKEELHKDIDIRGIDQTQIIFSPDSKNYAYFAQDNFISTVYINGKKGKNSFRTFDKPSPLARTLKFSPDGKKVTYIVLNNDAQYLVTESIE